MADHAHKNMILINTVPKSGSVYIVTVLQNSLKNKGYTFARISQSRFHDDYVDPSMILNAMANPFFTQGHIDAEEANLNMLKDYFPSFVLHLRDPRQATLSWLHHIEKYQNSYHLFSDDICPPDQYFEWSLHEKIDWQIEHYLPCLVTWMQNWIDVIDSKRFNILVTRFEDLQAQPMDFFTKIFDFYGLTDVTPQLIKIQQGQLHNRLGKIDEWRIVLSEEQIERMHELIPPSLLTRFGWE